MKYLKITSPDVNNGVGCRVTLWIPGCGHNCPGCHNKWTHDYNQGEEFTPDTYEYLKTILNKPYINGITISGGDPLMQNEKTLRDLKSLIERIKLDCKNKNIWLYTGYYIKDLNDLQKSIVDICDVIVEGPYVNELRDVSLEFRGSSNQNIVYN